MRFADKDNILLDKNFIVVFFVNFFLMMAYYLLFIISAPYATEVFNASSSVAGLVAGAMVLGCLAGRFVTGRFISTYGFKRVLLVGLVEYTITVALYLTAHNLPILLAVRFLSGIGIGIIGTVTGSVVAYVVPRHLQGIGISYFSLSTILAMAVGPFLGIFLMEVISYSSIFIFCSAVGLLAVFLALALSVSLETGEQDEADKPNMADKPDKAGRKNKKGFHLSDYIEFSVIRISVAVLIVSFGFSSVQAFMSSFAKEIGLVGPASMFFLVYSAVVFASRPFTGKLLDAKGANVIAYPALLLLVAGLLLLSAATSGWMMLLSGGLIGAGFGNFQSMGQAITAKSVPRHRLGQATSTFFIFWDLGVGFGPYLLGFVVSTAGFRWLYALMAGLMLALMPLYHVLHGKRARAIV